MGNPRSKHQSHRLPCCCQPTFQSSYLVRSSYRLPPYSWRVLSRTLRHCPRSTRESPSQSSHSPVPEKENVRSPASRRRTSDSRKVAGSSLSRLGTRSISNLRRSVSVPSSSIFSTADHSLSPSAHTEGRHASTCQCDR